MITARCSSGRGAFARRIGGFRLFGSGGETAELLGLFGTQQSTTYSITQPVAETTGGILHDVVSMQHGMQDVLDLLYDGDEQTTSFADGFRARPNLGCLVMAQHLRGQLRTGEGAGRSYRRCATPAPREQVVPVMVAASIFGGTGASLLQSPAAAWRRSCARARTRATRLKQYRWGAVMMLPHYRPQVAQ